MYNILRIDSTFLNTSVYLVSVESSSSVFLIDCGSSEDILKALTSEQEVKYVLLTHSHFDHIKGLNDILERFPDVVVCTNEYGAKALKDSRLNMSVYNECPTIYNGERILLLDNLKNIDLLGVHIDIIPTPGHDPSCLSYKMDNYLFTGDSYIPETKLFANFPNSVKSEALRNEEMLKEMEREGMFIFSGHHS